MAADAQNPGAKGSGSDRSEGAGPADDQARLQALSRKLLDLWQDHLSATAQDPNLLAQALKLMTAAPMAWMPGFPPTGFSNQGGPGFAQFPNPFQSGLFGGQPPASSATAGTATAAAASAAGADDVEQLRRRLAELEGRLAQLEGGTKPHRSKPGGSKSSGSGGAGKPNPVAGKPRRRAAKS
jgi:hypothetical protein